MSSPHFELEWEWLSADAVPVESHARTWARLVIRVGDACATQVEDLDTRTMRDGIRVPLMPLAEWVASNWWYLSHESPPCYPVRPARDAMANARAWYRRHDMLFAREGFSLPDLLMARADDERSLVQVAPDPRRSTTLPVRFVENQSVLVSHGVVERQLRRLVEAVLARLEGCEAADARELRDRWREINALSGDDLILRERAGALGLDGDNPEEVTDDLANWLVETLGSQPRSLLGDLLELPAQVATDIRALSWIQEARKNLRPGLFTHVSPARLVPQWAADARTLGETAPAHEVGWKLARTLRQDLLELTDTAYGEELDSKLEAVVHEAPHVPAAQAQGLRGLLHTTDRFTVALEPGSEPTRRFLRARALCLGVFGGSERLITDAPSWTQSVCRAFATELLAPRAYLETRVHGDVVSEECVEEFAKELNAPRRAVEHQIDNHHMARLD